MLEVRLFGPGQARYANRPLPGFPHQQSSALFCYLLLNRHRPHSREQLAAVFWNECPTPISRKRLRNAVWRLRHALGAVGGSADEYLRLDDDSIAFTSSSRFWLDVQVFEATIARYQNRTSHELTSEEAEALAVAVDLYIGDLLEGIYEDWCLYDRERLRILCLNALAKLMIFYGLEGAYERALGYGERILTRDNTRERVHRQMMQLYWLSGQRDRALAQYKVCVQILQDTLGIAPLAETHRLYHQMLRDRCDPTGWPTFRRPGATQSPVDESGQSLAELARERLHHLEALLEATRTELQDVEQLISQVVATSRPKPRRPPIRDK